MKCKDCEHLKIVERFVDDGIPAMWISCRKYNLMKYELVHGFEHLNCVENQKNFKGIVRGKNE